MILNRLGNKTKLVKDLLPLFPKHDIYIEPFFGAGGMYFNKPKAKYNFINDLDFDVYNLFRQLIDNKDVFIRLVSKTPIDEKQFKEWGRGKREECDMLNAIRFLWISNFGLYGKPDVLRIGALNPRKRILENIEHTFDWLKDAYFYNESFEKMFRKLDYKSNKDKVFVYCDSPYLDTGDNYSNSFTKKDSALLFKTLIDAEVKFGLSEFNHPFILEQAKKYNLNVHTVGERKNIKNKRVEIYVSNYELNQTKLIF